MAACCSHNRDIISKVDLVTTSYIRLCCEISSCFYLAFNSSLSIHERLKCSTILRHLAEVVDSSGTVT